MVIMKVWNEYIMQNKNRFLEQLKQFLAFPSISTDVRYKKEIKLCAVYIMEQLVNSGCDFAEVTATRGHPVVFGSKIIDPSKPTILVYGHYDVQPPDPIELWDSNPFEPLVKDGKIIARGASDDKGQLFMHVKAMETMIKTGTLSCNIKYIIEGEEETGSPSLNEYLIEHQQKLKADVVLASDTSMISMENPSIETALRGMVYMQVELTGPNRDLHSGVYGGAVANPAILLCKLIASLQDNDNRILLPGFYDKVVNLSEEQRKEVNYPSFDLQAYKNELGLSEILGEKGYTTLERTGIRPSLDVNGIWGGYTGNGAKTVLPAKAFAKISMRLVPKQEPEEIAQLFQSYFTQTCPPYVKIEVKYLHGGEPVTTPVDSRGFKAAQKAVNAAFGKEPVSTYSGGSIPVVAKFKGLLGLDTVLLGFGLDNDNIHSPNEKLDLFNFYKGIETIVYFHKYFSE